MKPTELEAENKRLRDAINRFCDVTERVIDSYDVESLTAYSREHTHATAGLYEAIGRTVTPPDFEDDDQSWHMGETPEKVRADWMAIWGKVAGPEPIDA